MIASLQRTTEPVNGSPTVPLVSPKDAGIRIPPKPIHHISVAAHGDAPKESTVVSKGFRATTMVGFASLPNQIHRKAVRRGFTFNLMIVGSPGLGKSSFINALFCSNIYCPENPGPSKRSSSESAVRVDSRSFLVNEADVKLRLCILDTPGFGQGLNNTECWQPIIKNIESHFDHYMRAELSVCRTTVGSGDSYLPSLPDDPRIHACIYFIPPGGHGLRQLDIETLKHLHAKVNLILVIGKADSMTPEECAEYKKVINQAITEHGIHLYAFPESVAGLGGGCDEKWLSEVRGWRNRQPFAVVSSDRWIEHADGKRIRGRSYPWGVVETENLAHNDFTALKNLLLNVHLQDLIDVTHSKHYANYYSTRLSSIAEASKFPVNEDAREPLSQLEIERIERQKRLTKLEADMEAVFEQKVQERTAKLSETERDLEQRAEQLNQNLATQLAEFEKQKREFDDARAIWESENRQALELVRASMEKLDMKEKGRSKRKGFF